MTSRWPFQRLSEEELLTWSLSPEVVYSDQRFFSLLVENGLVPFYYIAVILNDFSIIIE